MNIIYGWVRKELTFFKEMGLSNNLFFKFFIYRVSYAGDNFVRYTGDTISMAQTQCKCLLFYIKYKFFYNSS